MLTEMNKNSIFKNWPRLCFLLSISFLLSACAAKYTNVEKPQWPVKEITPYAHFTLSPGDTIDVKFFYDTELNEEALLIRPDGKISLQLVGDILIAGLTVDEARNKIIDSYKELSESPELTVILRAVHDRRIYVAGEVIAPGEYINDSGLTPFQAIIKAGGLKSTAEPRSIVVFRDTGEPVISYYLVDLSNSLKTLTNYRDFNLHEKDIVYVPTSQITDVGLFVNQYLGNIIPGWLNYNFNHELNQADYK